MARPPKDKKLLMNIPLRIMVTGDQKHLIDQAAQLGQLETSAWARAILLAAAKNQVSLAKQAKSKEHRAL